MSPSPSAPASQHKPGLASLQQRGGDPEDPGPHLRAGGDGGVHLVHRPLQCGARAQSDAITASVLRLWPRNVASGFDGVIERSQIMFIYFLSGRCLKIAVGNVRRQQSPERTGEAGGGDRGAGPSLKSDTRPVSALTVNLLCPAHPPTTVPGNVPLPSLLFFFSGLRFYLRDLTQQWCSVKLCKTHLFSNFPEVVLFVQHLNIFVVKESTGEVSHFNFRISLQFPFSILV